MTTKKKGLLPISQRPMPKEAAWLMEVSFLVEAGAQSIKTEKTYRSGLRTFADWLQHFQKDGYNVEMNWPLSADNLTTATILEFRNWLTRHRSRATVTTYIAAITSYLNYLDGLEMLTQDVNLTKLRRSITRRKVERNSSEGVIELEHARQEIPKIISYYDTLPLPAENDTFNRRLSLLRDRALVNILYSTAARISEVISLNRRSVDEGRAKHAIIVGKGNKARTLHLRDYAQKAIRAYLAERTDTNPALFIAHSRNATGSRLTITSAHLVVKRAVNALELHENLSAHDFRHYRATQLLREGMPLEVVQEFLGHSDISTTRGIYAPILGVQIVEEWLTNVDRGVVEPEVKDAQ